MCVSSTTRSAGSDRACLANASLRQNLHHVSSVQAASQVWAQILQSLVFASMDRHEG